MEQRKISMGQRIGYFFLSLLSLMVFFIIQIAASFIYVFVVLSHMIIPQIIQGTFTEQCLKEVYLTMQSSLEQNLLPINMIYQVIALAGFGIWYYFMVCYRKKVVTNKAMGIQAILGIPMLGVGVEMVVMIFLTGISFLFPKIIEDYEKLMDEAGMNTLTPALLLATVVLAPLVEELVFRGVILYYAQKMTKHFWIANFLQALLFGIGHLNLVQGSYAFLLGLIMGCIYYKYRSIKATILLHAGFNFVGSVISEVATYAVEQDNIMLSLTLEMVMILSGIIGLTLVLTDHKKKALYS